MNCHIGFTVFLWFDCDGSSWIVSNCGAKRTRFFGWCALDSLVEIRHRIGRTVNDVDFGDAHGCIEFKLGNGLVPEIDIVFSMLNLYRKKKKEEKNDIFLRANGFLIVVIIDSWLVLKHDIFLFEKVWQNWISER
mgnify:CR=1 FL=1